MALRREGPERARDPWIAALEAGLVLILVLVPLPFGAVGPRGRLALELAAFTLAAAALVRGMDQPLAVPRKAVRIGLLALLGLAVVQLLPVPSPVAGLLAPRAVTIRGGLTPPPEIASAEGVALRLDPAALDPAPSLSLVPASTASALRTGAAYAALLLVALIVTAERGVKRLAEGLVLSAALQGLYGTLVLLSGHDRIWNVPKLHFLDSATGTFVNRNHYAAFLAAALPPALALALDAFSARRDGRGPWLSFLGLLALCGLLLSFSRAGIAVGLLGLALTVGLARAPNRSWRIAGTLALLALAAVPLMRIGAARVTAGYASVGEDLLAPMGRVAVWGDTLRMAASFPVTGTGFGTFASAYPLFRRPEVRQHFSHAHSDPVQLLAEAGVVGLLLMGLVLAPVVVSIARGLRGDGGAMAVGWSAGLLALFLHALVDFDLHIPANGALAAILAGALLGWRWNDPSCGS